MKYIRPFLLVVASFALLLYVAGCTSKPRVYRAPDAAPLTARTQSAARHVQTARVKFAAATMGLRATQASHAKAVASQTEALRWVTLLVPAVDSLLSRAPDDLKPEVEDLKTKVLALSLEIERTTGEMTTTTHLIVNTRASQSEGTAELEKGNAEMNEINARLAPGYFAQVEALAAKASEESAGRATAENEVRALKAKNWIRRALEALAGLTLLAVGFLWFTGRLALAGTRAAGQIATKLP